MSDTSSSFNIGIINVELDAAIQIIKLCKSPGPHHFCPELFFYSRPHLRVYMLSLINMSWKTGKLPKEWKHAKVKFLRKSGKTDYYSASSYRPISLTSTLCKLMERIVLDRLKAYMESKRLTDRAQEGLRKFNTTKNALLRLVESVKRGFKQSKVTVACCVDSEKAYVSVWREVLV